MKAKVLIGIPSGGSVPIRFMDTYSFATKIPKEIGTTSYFNHRGTNAVTARNSCVVQMFQKKCTHLFFMDSDMVFPKDTLKKLLAHDKDIVGGFYVRKRKGFFPNVFQLGQRPGGKYMTEWLGEEIKEVEGIGTGCLLIKAKVFKTIGCPWFEYRWSGDLDGHMVTEDLVFCDKAKEKGFKIWCDGSVRAGHVNQMIIWPTLKPNTNKIEPI